MKYILFIILVNLIVNIQSNKSQLQAQMESLANAKASTQSLLQSLYATANQSNLKATRRSKEMAMLLKYQRDENKVHHSNTLNQPGIKASDYRAYDYNTYPEIVQKLKQLSQQHPNFLELKTAQELYGLPSPGGLCQEFDNENRLVEKPCLHYIAFLTNKEYPNKDKAQVI
jgi:hypothetical protein